MPSKIVVLMGYGPGLGDVVEGFVTSGATVYVGTTADEAANLKSDISVTTFTTDFTSYDSVARPIQTAYGKYGKVDIVISYIPKASPALPSSLPSTSFTPDLTLPVYLTRLSTYFFFESRYTESVDGKEVGWSGGSNARGGGWLIFVGPEPPIAGTDVEPLQAAQANGLLGYVRSLAVQATAERFGAALICVPTGGSEASVYDVIVEASSKTVPTDPMSNSDVFVRDGQTWKRQSTNVGQLTDLEHMQAFGFRLGATLMIGGAIKHSIRAQSIVLKRYSALIRLIGLAFLITILLFAGRNVRNWTLLLAGFIGASSAMSGGKKGKVTRRAGEVCSVGVFLGSGGHTGEALQLLSALDPARYTHRTYIHCTGDSMSLTKAAAFEATLKKSTATTTAPSYTFIEIPRARKVYQSKPSAVFTTTYSFLFAVWQFVILPAFSGRKGKPVFDVLLVNGPGTCVVIVAAFLLARLLGFATPQIVYVESFARVKSLSLSGKILKPFVDRFVVQWDQAEGAAEGSSERGWLV